jgi:hypothetical protein
VARIKDVINIFVQAGSANNRKTDGKLSESEEALED